MFHLNLQHNPHACTSPVVKMRTTMKRRASGRNCRVAEKGSSLRMFIATAERQQQGSTVILVPVGPPRPEGGGIRMSLNHWFA